MLKQNNPEARAAWETAMPHRTLSGSGKLRPFTYSYTLIVRTYGDGVFVVRQAGKGVESIGLSRTSNRFRRSSGAPFDLDPRYAFMTQQELDEWCKAHNATVAS